LQSSTVNTIAGHAGKRKEITDAATVVDDGQSTMTIAASGIHTVEFLGTQDDGGVSLDNFTFNPVVPIRR